MDTTASAAVVSALGDFNTDAIAMFVLVIPLAMALIITIAVSKKAIKWFRGWVRI